MRIGFTSIYAWRPHAEHMVYLARLARQAGHDVRFLSCDGALPWCYTRALKVDQPDWVSCVQCTVGGVRSWEREAVDSMRSLTSGRPKQSSDGTEWGRSSAATYGRFESDADFDSIDFRRLAERFETSARTAFETARRWIERERLDAVCLFNGRYEATRGVLEAATQAGIPYVSMERTWFGDGLQLLPGENCLGLRSIDQIMRAWRDVPLTGTQAGLAAHHIASRFLRSNTKEWRAYNLNPAVRPWPRPDARYRILLTPGSRNEVWGHPDWALQWPSICSAFDALMDHLGLSASDVVLRCHPNWGERIGPNDGRLSEEYFSSWARNRGVLVIPSRDPTSTLNLIEQAHAVVVCGGSAALEAGILGKQVIALGPSIYQEAGFQSTVYSAEALRDLRLHVDSSIEDKARQESIIRMRTLRFCYAMAYRVAQFVPYVRAVTTTLYRYQQGADPMRLSDLLRTGRLQADDPASAGDNVGEGAVLATVTTSSWHLFHNEVSAYSQARALPLSRRLLFQPIDQLREMLPRGDL